MKYFYNSNTETYWETITDPSEKTVSAYLSGTVEVVKRPSHLHTYLNNKWVDPSDEVLYASLAEVIREKRNGLLHSEVDRVVSNPLRWADMKEEKQEEWKAYRLALLDITAQAGFPNEVVWPTKPS
jgi:hypothetical protein